MNPFEPSPMPEEDDQDDQQPTPSNVADGSGAGELLEAGADVAGGALDAADLAGGALEGLGGCADGCGGCSLAVLVMLFATAGSAMALFR